jgi:hypothetical protein
MRQAVLPAQQAGWFKGDVPNKLDALRLIAAFYLLIFAVFNANLIDLIYLLQGNVNV